MANNNYTIESIIAEIQDDFGVSDGSGKDRLFNYAVKGMIDVGLLYYSEHTTKWIPVKNNMFDKPKNFVAPVKVELKQDDGCCVIPIHKASLDYCKCNNCCESDCKAYYVEQDCFFEIEGKPRYNWAKVKYLGLPMNSKGEYLVPVEAGEAVMAYVEYRKLKRQRRINNNSIPMSELQIQLQEYEFQRKKSLERTTLHGISEGSARREIGKIRYGLITPGVTTSSYYVNRLTQMY